MKVCDRLCGFRWFGLVLAGLVALDLWTKHLISKGFALGEWKSIIPGFFRLTYSQNTGAAFSIGASWSVWFFLSVSVVAIGVVLYLFFSLRPEEKLSRWGLTFILAGAIGNLVDRVRLGYVVDFLDVYVGRHHWPAFNVADSVILIGAVLYAIDIFFLKKKEVPAS